MPPLKNAKMEAFCLLVGTGGKSVAEAYVTAGYKASNSNSANAGGQKLLRTPTIVGRIAELKPIADANVQKEVARIAQVVENDLMTRVGRAKELIERLTLFKRLRLERAEYYSKQDYAPNMPGAGLGLVIARHKMIGSGSNAERTIEFEFDRGLQEEIRACENQLAVELGQRVDKNPGAAYSSLREVPSEVLEQWRQEAAVAAAREAEAAVKALPTGTVN